MPPVSKKRGYPSGTENQLLHRAKSLDTQPRPFFQPAGGFGDADRYILFFPVDFKLDKRFMVGPGQVRVPFEILHVSAPLPVYGR